MAWKRFSQSVLAFLSEITDGFPSQRASNAEFWCFFVVRVNKKELCYRWLQKPWHSSDVSIVGIVCIGVVLFDYNNAGPYIKRIHPLVPHRAVSIPYSSGAVEEDRGQFPGLITAGLKACFIFKLAGSTLWWRSHCHRGNHTGTTGKLSIKDTPNFHNQQFIFIQAFIQHIIRVMWDSFIWYFWMQDVHIARISAAAGMTDINWTLGCLLVQCFSLWLLASERTPHSHHPIAI